MRPIKTHTVIIVDDHPIFRVGITSILTSITWVNIIAEADNGYKALKLVEQHQPDIVFLDLEMPKMDGLSALEKILLLNSNTKVVILTNYDDEAYVKSAFKLGASAYVIKDQAGDDLMECLENITKGETYLSPSLGKRQILTLPPLVDKKTLARQLTKTETKILLQVAEFKTSKEIAESFNISFRTVQNHRANICQKLELKGSHQLIQFVKDHLTK